LVQQRHKETKQIYLETEDNRTTAYVTFYNPEKYTYEVGFGVPHSRGDLLNKTGLLLYKERLEDAYLMFRYQDGVLTRIIKNPATGSRVATEVDIEKAYLHGFGEVIELLLDHPLDL